MSISNLGQASGKPFAIPMIDRWIVFMTDREQLARLDREPESVLSTEEALHEVQPLDDSTVHLLKCQSSHSLSPLWVATRCCPKVEALQVKHLVLVSMS